MRHLPTKTLAYGARTSSHAVMGSKPCTKNTKSAYANVSKANISSSSCQ